MQASFGESEGRQAVALCSTGVLPENFLCLISFCVNYSQPRVYGVIIIVSVWVCVCVRLYGLGVCVCNFSVCALQITLGTILPNFYLAYSCNTFLGECENHIDTAFTENKVEPN